MKIPWYQHDKFEMRIIVFLKKGYFGIYHTRFKLQVRELSKIPFVKFTNWKYVGDIEFETLDEALDSLSSYKNHYLNKSNKSNLEKSKPKLDYTWDKIKI